jgi:hypothetical protein
VTDLFPDDYDPACSHLEEIAELRNRIDALERHFHKFLDTIIALARSNPTADRQEE